MAGCPKCAVDLVRANPHKEFFTHPNGFVSFKELRAGEELNLPDKWFNGELDSRPKRYFEALPSHDGRTPSKLGLAAAGVLSDYATLDSASASVAALAQMSDQLFSDSVDATIALINQSVTEARSSANPTAAGYVQDTMASLAWARTSAAGMAAALEAGDKTAAAEARPAIQNVLSTAVGSARLALQAFYSNAQPASTPVPFPAAVTAAAQTVAAAVSSDTNYCASVAQSGSAVNAAVHAFKTAWNASQSPKVPVGTGNYEQATADALTRVLGTAPAACGAREVPSLSVPTSPTSSTALRPPKEEKGISTGAIIGLGLLGAGAVGGAIYLATRDAPSRRRPRVRRVRPRPSPGPMIRPERYDTIGPRKKRTS